MKNPDLSILIPVYKNAPQIRGTLKKLRDELRASNFSYDTIIAVDGCSEGEEMAIRSAVASYPHVHVIASRKRKWRGKALTDAMRASAARIVLYMDMDMSTDIRNIRRFMQEIKTADIVIASRLLPGSRLKRGQMRDFISRVYNFLLRILFKSAIHDHQCGFKAFRRNAVLPLLDRVKAQHWFWDSEILVIAQREGLRVKELPVTWKESGSSTVRVLSDSIHMFLEMMRFYMQGL